MLARIGAVAGTLITLLTLYFIFVKTIAFSVEVAAVEFDEDGVETDLIFTNLGELAGTVSEINLFVSRQGAGTEICKGEKYAATIFAPVGAESIYLAAGEQKTIQVPLKVAFDSEARFELCIIFEVNHPKETTRADPISFLEFSVLEGTQFSDGLDRVPRMLVHTRMVRKF